jgi:glyoxylase-like metal-dependent hydrolase (beta-lactamase superfamily II)
MRALATGRADEVVLWLPAQRAVVSGDVLLGGVRKPLRVCPKSWLPRGVARSDVARALMPLRELPVELVVPLHGEPVTTGAREVLAAALDEAS